MVIQTTQRRFYSLAFFLLYFFWDRLFEGLFSIPWMGIFRPVVILLLWMNVLLNWQYLKFTVGNYRQLLNWFYLIAFMALILFLRSVYIGIPMGAITYIYFQHFGFLPIVLLLASFANHPIYVRKILRVFMISSILLAFGVIFDSWIGIENIFNSDIANRVTRVGVQGIKRGDFTIGSTNVFIALSVGVVAVYFLVRKFNYSFIKAVFSLSFITTGMYASGSRASFLLGIVLTFFVILGLLKMKRNFLINGLFVAVMCGAAVLFTSIGVLEFETEKLERYDNLFEEENEGNLDRYVSWARGLNMIFSPINIPGNGIGTTSPKTNELFGTPFTEGHFESSFFARYYEGGVIGIVIFLFPLVLSFRICEKKNTTIIFACMLLLFVNFSISPTAVGYQSNLVIFIVLGLSLMLSSSQFRPGPVSR
jgi:hypothetical protein